MVREVKLWARMVKLWVRAVNGLVCVVKVCRAKRDLPAAVAIIPPGKLADVIVIDGDPLTDMTSMRHVVHVVKDGTVYK